MRTVLSDFARTHSQITIQPTSLALGGYWDKLNTEFAGKSAPDWIMMDDHQIARYVKSGALAPLNKVVGSIIKIDQLPDYIVAPGRFNGKLYCVPLAINTQVLLYNETMVKQYGLKMPGNDMTWDAFGSMASRLANKTSKRLFGTTDQAGSFGNAFEVWVRSQGKELFSADGKSLGFSESDLTDWWTYWQMLRKSGAAASPDVQAQADQGGAGSPADLMVSHRSFVTFDWSPQLSNYAGLMTDKVAGHLLPLGSKRPGQFLKGANYYSSPNFTQVLPACAEIANYMINNKTASKALGATLGVPASAAIEKYVSPSLSGADRAQLEYVNLAKRHNTPRKQLWPPAIQTTGTPFSTYAQKLAFGQVSLKDAVSGFFETAQKQMG